MPTKKHQRHTSFALSLALLLACSAAAAQEEDESAVGISGAIQHLSGMTGSQVIVAVNKIDNEFREADMGTFYRLGLGTPFATSAMSSMARLTSAP